MKAAAIFILKCLTFTVILYASWLFVFGPMSQAPQNDSEIATKQYLEQLKAADAQMKASEKQLRRSEEMMAKEEALLSRWEKVIEKWEKIGEPR